MRDSRKSMTTQELLEYIDESALSKETQSDPELQKMFNSYYALKDKNLDRALGELYQHIRTYQFDHHFKTPGFLVTINLELSKPSAVDDTARWGSLLNWFQ